MNIEALLDALGLQEDAARVLADDLRGQIDELHGRLREAEIHLEHLAITRKTITGLADRLPVVPPDLPEHPDYPRILAVQRRNRTTARQGRLRRPRPRPAAEEHRAHLRQAEAPAQARPPHRDQHPQLHHTAVTRNPRDPQPYPASPRNGHQLTNRPLSTRGPCNIRTLSAA
jgi:hypothetical protein